MHRGEGTHFLMLGDVALMTAFAEILADDLPPKSIELLSVCEERSVGDRRNPHTIGLYLCVLSPKQWLGLDILRANRGRGFTACRCPCLNSVSLLWVIQLLNSLGQDCFNSILLRMSIGVGEIGEYTSYRLICIASDLSLNTGDLGA